MLGAIRQELLSGVRSADLFATLRDRLRAFADVALDEADYEDAATCFNRCRSRGIQGSNTDFLICAVSQRQRAAILTVDQDFVHFARVLRVRLHQLRG
jgi:predicted nucleic acid-binding protein